MFLCVFGGRVARTARSSVLALGFGAWEVPQSSPFISAASFPKGKGTSIDYLFGAGGSGGWEAGGCWLLAGRGWAQNSDSKDGVSKVALLSHPVQGPGWFEVDLPLLNRDRWTMGQAWPKAIGCWNPQPAFGMWEA